MVLQQEEAAAVQNRQVPEGEGEEPEDQKSLAAEVVGVHHPTVAVAEVVCLKLEVIAHELEVEVEVK